MEETIEKYSWFFDFSGAIVTLLILIVAYFIGNYIEKRHFLSIRKREADAHGFPVVSFDTAPESWNINSSHLVTGSVVISLDYFKRVIAGLRGLIGGRIKTYEPLLERARREALLRFFPDARDYDHSTQSSHFFWLKQ